MEPAEEDDKNNVYSTHEYTKALRSAGGLRRPLRSLTRIKQNAIEADRDPRDFRCELTACKCQELQTTRTPHACTKYMSVQGNLSILFRLIT